MTEAAEDRWLTTDELAARLRKDPATLRTWRHRGTGPLAVKIGGERRYRLSTVIAWENEQEQQALRDREWATTRAEPGQKKAS